MADAPPFRTIRDFLDFAVKRFNEASLHFGHGSNNAHDEAAYLILRTLNLPLDEPVADRELSRDEIARISRILELRINARIPAAYLTNEAWLSGFRFYADERAIVPRSHIAELLCAQLSPWIAEPENVTCGLDLCTGSGCLAILMAYAFPNAKIDATDISFPALEVARRNVADYRLQERVDVIQSDLFAALQGRCYDLIVCNPPYVTRASMQKLPREYLHEPRDALAGGEDGLDFVERIIADAHRYLTEHGVLVVETGDKAIEAAYPDLCFLWLATESEESCVFLLTRDQLP